MVRQPVLDAVIDAKVKDTKHKIVLMMKDNVKGILIKQPSGKIPAAKQKKGDKYD